MSSELWSYDTPLFFYGNEEKLNDLLSRIYNSVITSIEVQKRGSFLVKAKITEAMQDLFNSYGLPIFDFGGSFGYEKIRTKVEAITFDRKLGMLNEYCHKKERYPYYNLHDGVALKRDLNSHMKDWESSANIKADNADEIGNILGIFTAERIIPPPTSTTKLYEDLVVLGSGGVMTNITSDYLAVSNNLWLLSTVADSKIKAEIPILINNIRPISQHALLAFATQSRYKIEALGLLTWRNDIVTCDPVAWRLFY